MSTYATTYALALGDQQRRTVLVNRNRLPDADEAVRLDVLDDAGPAMHRDGTAYLTADQAAALGRALVWAAGGDVPDPAPLHAPIPARAPSYATGTDKAVRAAYDALTKALDEGATAHALATIAVCALRRLALPGQAERDLVNMLAAHVAELNATDHREGLPR